MPQIVLACQVVLALTMVVAGGAKLADRSASRHSLEGLGLSARLARPLATLLPAAEIILGLLLVVPATARGAAAGAAVLVAAGSVLVGRAIARGRPASCGCFGALSDRPAGAGTLVRNGALLVAAVLVAALGAAPLGPWAALALVSALAVAAGAGWLAARVRGRRRTLEDVPRLPARAVAPDLVAREPGGPDVRLADLLADGAPVAIVFTRPGCGPCRDLLPRLAPVAASVADRAAVVVASPVPEDAGGLWAPDEEGALARAYRVPGTPAAVVVGPDGRVALPMVLGAEAVLAMVAGLGDGGASSGVAEPAVTRRRALVAGAAAAALAALPVGARAASACGPTCQEEAGERFEECKRLLGDDNQIFSPRQIRGFCRTALRRDLIRCAAPDCGGEDAGANQPCYDRCRAKADAAFKNCALAALRRNPELSGKQAVGLCRGAHRQRVEDCARPGCTRPPRRPARPARPGGGPARPPTVGNCQPPTYGCVGSDACCYEGDTCCAAPSVGIVCCIYADCRCVG